jgi:hypothetical protein
MSDALLAIVVTGGFGAAVLFVLWLLTLDSRPESLNALERFELDFSETETKQTGARAVRRGPFVEPPTDRGGALIRTADSRGHP